MGLDIGHKKRGGALSCPSLAIRWIAWQLIWRFARSSAVHLDLDLFGEAFVGLTQDDHDLFAAGVIRDLAALGQPLAQPGAGWDDAVFLGA